MADTKAPDEFVAAYIECALWSSTDDDGNSLDARFGNDDISTDVMSKAWADCDAFYSANRDDIEADDAPFSERYGSSAARAGHDFWLTRCGHGAGFWDGDWPEPAASRLTRACKAFPNIDLYVGDDGMIYGA